MSGWQILDLLNFNGKVSTERGAFVIDDRRVPLASVCTALIGPKCSIGAGVPHHAAKHDVSLIFCDWKGEPLSALMPWSQNTRVGARQRAQASLSEPRRKNAWNRIIKAKVGSRARTLEQYGHATEAKELRTLVTKVRSGDPDNIEARAARTYWAALYRHLEFTRVPGADDALNAVHNYGYTVLRGKVMTATIAAGLIPSLGIFHHGRSNPFALADDLIEPFRAVVDRTILQYDVMNIALNATVKKTLVDAIKPPEGNAIFNTGSAIDRLASAYAQYVEGNSDYLRVPTI